MLAIFQINLYVTLPTLEMNKRLHSHKRKFLSEDPEPEPPPTSIKNRKIESIATPSIIKDETIDLV